MIDEVTRLLTDVAAAAILPRFGRLAADDVAEKAPDDPVTTVDREAERLITDGLREILDVPVVGEEATTEDPGLLDALDVADMCWVVDPIDGTANFISGRREYAVMTALVRDGEPVAGWIVLPSVGQVYVAERGAGAFRDGTRLNHVRPAAEASGLRGAAPTRRLDPAGRARLAAVAGRFAELGQGALCAGVNYTRMAEGALDFTLYQRSYAWDHAAGVVLLEEVGGISCRPDGARYLLAEDPRSQLLNAASSSCWETVRRMLQAG